MRDFFGLDGPFNKYGGLVADTVILSLMWLLFSLPILTMGAATTAMYYVATRRIANREGYITGDFWQSFKDNFKRATALWLIVLVMGLLLAFNILNVSEVGDLGSIVLPAQIVFVVILSFICVFLFPVTARFDMGVWQTIRTCFFMSIRHFITSATCVILFLLFLFGTLFYFQVALFVAPGVYAMLSSYMLMRVFKKYRPEMDKDPVLELQEIETRRAEERRWQDIGTIKENEEDKEIPNETSQN